MTDITKKRVRGGVSQSLTGQRSDPDNVPVVLTEVDDDKEVSDRS